MCGIFLFSATMYFTKYEMVKGFFEALNYPTYVVYPLAVAKLLGVIAVLSDRSKVLKEWAYVGFFFDMSLALTGHLIEGDGAGMFSVVGLISWTISYYIYKKRGE